MTTIRAQHTPGPWKTGNKNSVWSEPRHGRRRKVCTVNENNQPAANARLIAAAPELLEALERWDEYARDNGYSENQNDTGYCSFLSDTRKAIKKARGEA